MVRRLLTFLSGATPVSFESPHPLQESVARLRAATERSVLRVLDEEMAVGQVSADRVSLQRVIPFAGNSFKPFFVGRFEPAGTGCRLVGHFTMKTDVKVFFTLWCGVFLLQIVMAGAAESSSATSEEGYPTAVGIGMLVFGLLLVLTGKWFARNDMGWLSDVIETALSADRA